MANDKVCITYYSNYFNVISNKHGATIAQVSRLLEKIGEIGAVAFPRLSEEGKICNCLTWTFLMTMVPGAEFQETIRLAIPQIITFLSNDKWFIRQAGADALLKLSEQGKISNFLPWTLLMYS